VEVLAPGVREVAFSNKNGQTYASPALEAGHLLKLYREP
jgi:hypothetical protein